MSNSKSVHTKPAVASASVSAIGLAALVVTFLSKGTVPSSEAVTGLLGGFGLTASGPLSFFLGHWKPWLAKYGPIVERDLQDAQPILASVPGLQGKTARLESNANQDAAAFESKVAAFVAKYAPAIDIDAIVGKVKDSLVSDALHPAVAPGSVQLPLEPVVQPAAAQVVPVGNVGQ